jgi:hypothetical protein
LCDRSGKPAIKQIPERLSLFPVDRFCDFNFELGRVTHMVQQIKNSGSGLVVVAVALSLAACAGTRVNDRVVSTAPSAIPLAAPHTVQVQVSGGEDEAQFSARHAGTPADESEAVAGLSAGLAELLAQHGLTLAPTGQSPDLILRCVVTDARSGSKLKRIVVGLGAGKARLQLQVALIDQRIGPRPVLSFVTVSTTGAAPGAAIPVGPGGAIGAVGGAYGLYKGSKSGLPLEEVQTQKKIDEQLKGYFNTNGWTYAAPAHAQNAT